MPDWNAVYKNKNIEDATPASILIDNEQLLDSKGKALDYACGLSGNGFYLAEKGFQVSAWDASEVAVQKINDRAKNKNIQLQAEIIDLENNLPDIKNSFDVIVVSYFLHRDTLPFMYTALKKGGLLFYQTFSGDQLNGVGPSNKNFRLQRGELLKVFSSMELLFYREDSPQLNNQNNKSDQVCFVAKK